MCVSAHWKRSKTSGLEAEGAERHFEEKRGESESSRLHRSEPEAVEGSSSPSFTRSQLDSLGSPCCSVDENNARLKN